MSIFLAILAQIGPFPSTNPQPVSPLPPEILERKQSEAARQRAPRPAPAPQEPVTGPLAECIAEVKGDPTSAVDIAGQWLDRARGTERAEAGQCLGMALAQLGRWDAAESAFLSARSAADPQSQVQRAKLAAMAGNAALARGEPQQALADLEIARGDAQEAGSQLLVGEIDIDRSRALVALGRLEEARDSLAEARNDNPNDPQAWLLSATLSRRMGDLAMAQVQIEEAARLLPIDPEIGLEAGVIAMLAGHEDAARKSWQSVIDAAPDSEAAGTARGYLAQLNSKGEQAKP